MGPQDLLFLPLVLFSLQGFSSHGMSSPSLTHGFSSIAKPSPRAIAEQRLFNVDNFGAKGKGNDDRNAFMDAWTAACSSHLPAIYMVPQNRRYILKPITFNGPCKSMVTVMIMGTIEAPSNRLDWVSGSTAHWILFSNITNLIIKGGGTIIGNGDIWWKNSCKINSNLPCTVAPTALTLSSCNELRVENLKIKNSQQIHVSVEECNDGSISDLMITAPEDSPNTDGIHLGNSRNILIRGCVIKTGDDCISIASGSQHVRVMNIVCGPGHGISIGSLGENKSIAKVSDVTVENVTLVGTTNGVRIKTWQGGQGYAKNIAFQNITMHNVYNPIIIDQNYCDSLYPCHEERSAVSVSQVIYKNIKGTSATNIAVKLSCSRMLPCQKIRMQNIRLVGGKEESTKSLCNHVKLATSDKVVPPLCI